MARRGAAVGERGQAAGAGDRARGWKAMGPPERDPAREAVDPPELDGHGAAGAGSGHGAVDPPELEVPRAADSPEMGEGREREERRRPREIFTGGFAFAVGHAKFGCGPFFPVYDPNYRMRVVYRSSWLEIV